MQIRTVDGGILDADEQPEAVMRIMGEDGVVIICQRSTISVPMNSLNRVQALESRGDLGYTTFEFMDREIFMSSAVAKILFLLHGQYNMGTSKLLIPVPRFEDTALRSYNAYVATLFGGPQNVHVTFHLTVHTASQQRKMVTERWRYSPMHRQDTTDDSANPRRYCVFVGDFLLPAASAECTAG